jgi:hypothetical protein
MQKLPGMRRLPKQFWIGLLARWLCLPFLLQWFHPDERQMLELAHFLAHGRLHPFLESHLMLRNLSLPWIFSWVIRGLDGVGLHHPWAYLIAIQGCIGTISWIGLWILVECFRIGFPAHPKIASRLGWFFALFWGFPFLYSRQLLEAVSLPAACFLLYSLRRQRNLASGFWAGAGAILRYPSALWAGGGFLVWVRRSGGRGWARRLAPALLGFAVAIVLGGLADWLVYGSFLQSAPAYWHFNRPGGPVAHAFGSDSLWVYWRWFVFLFTPWGAFAFILIGAYALACRLELLLFASFYILGHLWTPHREPRFLLPLTPFLVLAIAEAWAAGNFAWIDRAWKRATPALRRVAIGIVFAHIALNFVWYPMNAWGQWKSALGQVIRHNSEIGQAPTELLDFGDPLLDVLVPMGVRWASSDCQWHRPPIKAPSPRLWVIRKQAPANCSPALTDPLPALRSPALERLLRVRIASLWSCPRSVIKELCPAGVRDNPPGEPYLGLTLPTP